MTESDRHNRRGILFAVLLLMVLSWLSCNLIGHSIWAQSQEQLLDDLNGRWVLNSLNGRQVPGRENVYVVFDDGNYTGHSFCNSMGGGFEVSRNGDVTFTYWTTLLGCDYESEFDDAWSANLTVLDDQLLVKGQFGETLMVFDRDE